MRNKEKTKLRYRKHRVSHYTRGRSGFVSGKSTDTYDLVN